MAFTFKEKLMSPHELRDLYPLSVEGKRLKSSNDDLIKRVFSGDEKRFLFIIGPCSAHDHAAVLDYVHRLVKLQEKVKEKAILLPRIYTNKPRTLGTGYKGMLHQPDPEKLPNMVAGIKAIRLLHKQVIEDTGLPVADEMLYPENHEYITDLLSYVAIGARSVENQLHRLTASGLDIAVGMKNPTSGDFGVMLNSVQAAQVPHIFGYNGYEVESSGNPYAHAILRGAVTSTGRNIANYHYEDLLHAMEMYTDRSLNNAAIIVDTNHANSGKKFREQPRIVKEIFNTRNSSPELKKIIKGVMVESFIEGGSQKPEEGVYGKSITDPCLGWKDTEKLVMESVEKL